MDPFQHEKAVAAGMEGVVTTHIDDLLLAGDSASMADAARHAAGCAACADELRAWNDIGDTARSLHATWQNDLLWPRIERDLRNDRRSHPLGRLWQVAAAALLTVGIGGGTWYTLHVRNEQRAFDKSILRASAVEQVEAAERTHVAAIRQLEQLAGPRLAEAGSPLMVSYKEKLMLLDDAIAECETNIERNRNNAHLRRQLLTMYSDKQQTLEQVLREGTNASNQ
jgi:hypothetical protein